MRGPNRVHSPLLHALPVGLLHEEVRLCCVPVHLDLGVGHAHVDVLERAHEVVDQPLAVLAHDADHAVVGGRAVVYCHLRKSYLFRDVYFPDDQGIASLATLLIAA